MEKYNTIGFFGCGNMGGAIIDAIISKNTLACEILVKSKSKEHAESFAKNRNVTAVFDENELLKRSDVVVLAVKPNSLNDVLDKIKTKCEKKLIISLAAGKEISFFEDALGSQAKIVRLMPNMNALVRESITAICKNENVTENDLLFVHSFCEAFGSFLDITEDKFSIFSAVGACSPAFCFSFIDALKRAGVSAGLKSDEALKIAAQSVFGSAKTVLESDDSPADLIDKVCSPGGTTISGMLKLDECGFNFATEQAVLAAYSKDKELK